MHTMTKYSRSKDYIVIDISTYDPTDIAFWLFRDSYRNVMWHVSQQFQDWIDNNDDESDESVKIAKSYHEEIRKFANYERDDPPTLNDKQIPDDRVLKNPLSICEYDVLYIDILTAYDRVFYITEARFPRKEGNCLRIAVSDN